ncbi:MAG: lipoate--protein ligase family protein [Anaerolineales bacterium]|nr:lipoate--protein ligase family protein [Anaerolineales bacterium]
MNPIRLINLGAVPPWQTQAIYHALGERMDENQPDTIVLCRPNEPYLCLGYHQVFESIFDPAECARRGLPVYRRRLGGGATYLDGNQIFYQCIFHHTHMPVMLRDIYSFALAGPVNTLKRIGLNGELRETNEIEVDGKRIAGTGGGRIEDAAIVVGNVLFDFDYEAMTAVWQAPNTAFRSLAQKALHQRVVTMKDLMPNVSMEQVETMLIEDFAKSMKREIQPGTLTDEEWQAAEEEAKELASSEYLDLHKSDVNSEPMRNLKISARAFIRYTEADVNGFHVRGTFWLSEEIIQEAVLESAPERDWKSVEQILRGVAFKDWQEKLTEI